MGPKTLQIYGNIQVIRVKPHPPSGHLRERRAKQRQYSKSAPKYDKSKSECGFKIYIVVFGEDGWEWNDG